MAELTDETGGPHRVARQVGIAIMRRPVDHATVSAIVDRHVAAALSRWRWRWRRRAPVTLRSSAYAASRSEQGRRPTPPLLSAPTSRPPPPSGTTEGGDGTKQQARRVEPTGRRWNTYDRSIA